MEDGSRVLGKKIGRASGQTNTIEGDWSNFQRGGVGSYRKASNKFLPLYVAESQFHYNNCFNGNIFGVAIEGC
jgi:hypothetical protein